MDALCFLLFLWNCSLEILLFFLRVHFRNVPYTHIKKKRKRKGINDMSAQAFTQTAAAFLAGITAMNILISFMEICIGEMKKRSIMERKVPKKQKYAVLHMVEKTA